MTPTTPPAIPSDIRASYWRGFISALAIALILAWALPDAIAWVG